MHRLTRPRRLLRRFEPGPRALILVYHRVDDAVADPWDLAVSPGRLAEHLEVLRERFHPLPLAELVADLPRRRLPDRAVAVTFDDGYADNLICGVPALERHGIPATIYVSAGFLGGPNEFWWKQVEQLLLEPGDLPRQIGVDHPLLRWSFDLGPNASYPPEDARRYGPWSVSDPIPTARHAAFVSLHSALQLLPHGAQDGVLAEVFASAGVDRAARPSHRMLTAEEVRALARNDLTDVGAHTLTHPRLAGLNAEQQAREILGSKERLEEISGTRVTSFAYPFGEDADYDATSVRLVEAAGFASAGSVRDIAVSRSSPQYELPRVVVRDWDAQRFERQLEWWLRRGL